MKSVLVFFSVLFAMSFSAQAQDVEAKLKPFIEEGKKWAASPEIVNAVKKANTTPDPKYADMTQDKWKALKITDPLVRDFTRNDAASFIKKMKKDVVSEAFVSAANGTKVAFLAKTSGWSHKGNAKHDQPMAGKVWIGKVEVDESAGVQQVQFAVPVMDGTKVIGSLVVGVQISKL